MGARVDQPVRRMHRQALRSQVGNNARDPPWIAATAIHARTDVVHHHLRATSCQQATVSQAQATGSAGDQTDLAGEREGVVSIHAGSMQRRLRAGPIPMVCCCDTLRVSRAVRRYSGNRLATKLTTFPIASGSTLLRPTST